jgi:hypothetical protein
VPGQLVGGRLASTTGRTLALRYAGLHGAAVLVGLAVRAAGANALGVALAGLFSLLIFFGQPITNQLVARSTRAGRRGTAYFSLSFGLGALSGVAGGVVADRAGLAAVFGFLGLVAIVNTVGGLIAALLLGRTAASTTPASRL